jgi:hypothetical protein
MPLAPPIDTIQQPAVGIYGLPVGASAGAMVLLTAAQIRTHADLSGYVPYTGATGAVTLGEYGLTCGNITSTNLITSNETTTTTWEVPGGQNLTIQGKAGILNLSDGNQNLKIVSTSVTLGVTNGRDLLGCRNLYQANGTTAVIQTIEKTFTSATSREWIQSGWNATDSAYDVGVSYQGSAGGSLQAVRIGNRSAAGTFAGLTVATTGIVTFSNHVALTNDLNLSAGTQVAWATKSQLRAIDVNGTLRLANNASTAGIQFDVRTDGTLKLWDRTLSSVAKLDCGQVTCSAITASGTILTRNGTSPTSIQITNTYTSATSFGLLDIRANAAQTAYEISSFLGSAGGANLPINIGHRIADGTFTIALSVATNGEVSFNRGDAVNPVFFAGNNEFSLRAVGSVGFRTINNAQTGTTDAKLVRHTTATLGLYANSGLAIRNLANSADAALTCGAITASGQIIGTESRISLSSGVGGQLAGYINTVPIFSASTSGGFRLQNTVAFGFANISAGIDAAADATISRQSAGVVQIGTTSNNALGSLACAAITASGTIIQVPPASVTLETNGQFSIEMTSDTAGNLVYRGSDGTTRRAALTFA